jgi:branched-subunit amino acid aminotransferase/4-amino-4-deoxychorismate lyase
MNETMRSPKLAKSEGMKDVQSWQDTTQNRKITSRATISVLALVALAFSGVAAAEQLYVNESGWWRDSGAFNASTASM